MRVLQDALNGTLSDVSEQFLQRLIEKKLRGQGMKFPDALPERIARHILSGNKEVIDIDSSSGDVTLEFDQSEIDDLVKAIRQFRKKDLPRIIESAATSGANDIFRDLKARWSEEYSQQVADISGFRERMEARWGKALGQLRMLITIIREWCGETHKAVSSMRTSKKKRLLELQVRLLARACQTADEIVCLLENGFADGAMARWRTLHEIHVVAAILDRHGPPIAERYVAHQAVESKRAMDKYAKCCGPLGFKPLSVRVSQRIEKAYSAAVVKYGREFGREYGWAAHHLKIKQVTFTDLEQAAGHDAMRSFYQMGNDNIHAGIKSMFVRLGALFDYDRLIAGRSNAGLTDPGQNAAHTLTQIAVMVCNRGTLDDIVAAKIVVMLRDEIPRAFDRAHNKLRKDHRKYTASA